MPFVLAAHDDGHGLIGSAAFTPLSPGSGLTVKIWAPEKQFVEELDRYGPEGYSPVAISAGGKLSLIHISEPTRLLSSSYDVFCLKKTK